MRNTMLEYSKMILSKVSFNKGLFRKELNKSLNNLEKSEAEDLRKWVVERKYLNIEELSFATDLSENNGLVA